MALPIVLLGIALFLGEVGLWRKKRRKGFAIVAGLYGIGILEAWLSFKHNSLFAPIAWLQAIFGPTSRMMDHWLK